MHPSDMAALREPALQRYARSSYALGDLMSWRYAVRVLRATRSMFVEYGCVI